MNNRWLDDIRKRMHAFKADEPEGLWEDLRGELGIEPAAGRRSPLLLGGTVALAFAAVAVAFLVIRFTPRTQPAESDLLAVSTPAPRYAETVHPERREELASNPAEETLHQTGSDLPAGSSTAAVPGEATGFSGNGTTAEQHGTDELSVSEEAAPQGGSTGNGNAAAAQREMLEASGGENTETPIETAEPSGSENTSAWDELLRDESGRSKGNGLSVNLFAAGVTGYSNSVRSLADAGLEVAGQAGAQWEDSPLLGIMLFNRGENTSLRKHHYQPFRVGLSLSYNFTDRLALTGGLTYSLLPSVFKEGGDSHYIETRQNLHYVGVPLTLNYNFYSLPSWDFYLSGGTLAEKCVTGKITDAYFIGCKAVKEESSTVSEKPWQFSVNLSAGVQYRLAPAVRLYAEPGLAYYFNDGSNLSTVYKERPLNFDFRLGLRFAF